MIDLSQFLHPKLDLSSIDTYVVRTTILNSIKSVIPRLKGTLLDLGCGHMPYKRMILENSSVSSYIGMDLEPVGIYKNNPDMVWDGNTIPLEDNSVDCIIATELFEHCPEAEKIIKETYRVLKDDGVLFFTVPFLWPVHDVPFDYFRYTPFALDRMLSVSGFKSIIVKPLGLWISALLVITGLFVKRRPMNKRSRSLILGFVYPVHFLLRKAFSMEQKMIFSSIEQYSFSESELITGLWGIAYKKSGKP